ncbi:Cytochrome b5 [Halotydeus destructor]|nr:Cytochrome b5 [Halotydeus destructor]
MAVREFTEEEVASHKTKTDLWLIIHGSVYDVTSYLAEHPGGDIVLLQSGGQDSTDEFEDNGHSEDARELMEQYKIGVIAEKKVEKKISSKAEGSSSLWARAVLIGAVATLAYTVYRKLSQ